jgi:hypothetical protein
VREALRERGLLLSEHWQRAYIGAGWTRSAATKGCRATAI